MRAERRGRLILVRHGESEGNRARVFTPTPEVPLTEAGREQVRVCGDWIASRFAPVAVVSSPFRRARQTSDILAARLGVDVRVEEDLRERAYGMLTGQPYASARQTSGWDPDRYWLWCPPGGGETLVDVAARAGAVLDRLARQTPDADVVVVSHGAVMHALWRHVDGSWSTRKVARNAGVFVVEHRGGVWDGIVAIGEA